MSQRAFCVFCSLPLKVYGKKHVSFLEMAVFFTVSIIFTYLVWENFHYAGVVLFCFFVVITELIHRVRWRSSVKCKGCGFDPVLYKASPERAAQTVQVKLTERKHDPLYMLKPQPQIKPIIRKVKDYRPPSSKDLSV